MSILVTPFAELDEQADDGERLLKDTYSSKTRAEAAKSRSFSKKKPSMELVILFFCCESGVKFYF